MSSTRDNSFTELAELLASQHKVARKENKGQYEDDDDDGPSRERLSGDSPEPPDYIPPFTKGAVGLKYVVIKGIQSTPTGSYSNLSIYSLLMCVFRKSFPHQVYGVPGYDGKSFPNPHTATIRRGPLEYLTRTPAVIMSPVPIDIPWSNAWPEQAERFVVFHGTKPGP